jgi:ribosomal protein S18 acetylase RimI-like enzyme
MNSSLVVTDIEVEDIPELSILYALAFYDNPCYASLFAQFPDSEKYRALVWFCGKRLSIAKSLNWLMLKVKSTISGKIVGACCAIPPGRDPSFLDIARSGMLLWPYYWGFNSFNSFFHVMKQFRHYEGWELSMVAIHPDSQGKGIGHILLKQIITAIQQRSEPGKEIVIHLATQRDRNLAFYEKAGGFAVLCQEQFTYYDRSQEETYSSWTMKLVIPNHST